MGDRYAIEQARTVRHVLDDYGIKNATVDIVDAYIRIILPDPTPERVAYTVDALNCASTDGNIVFSMDRNGTAKIMKVID